MLESVFAYLLNCTYYGGVLILYTMLTRLVVRKASRKICYFLWGFVAFRLLCAWTPPFLRLPGGFMPRALPFQNALLSGPEGGRIALKATHLGDVVQVLQLPFVKERASWLMTALSLIWILGVIVFAARGIMSYRRLTRALCGARLLEGGVYPVYLSGAVSSPFAMGIFNKRVYVPEGLDEVQLKMAVSHEHTHLSRSDPLLKLIAYAIRTLHWFNPLAYAAYRLWCADMEYTCDERLCQWMGSEVRPDYCRALLDVSAGARPMPCPAAFSEGDVKRRVKNLMKGKRHRILWGILAFVLVLNMCALGLTQDAGWSGWRPYMDADVRKRLFSLAEKLSQDPTAAYESGYFDICEPPTGTKKRPYLSDEEAAQRWFEDMLTDESSAHTFVRFWVDEQTTFRLTLRVAQPGQSLAKMPPGENETGVSLFLQDASVYDLKPPYRWLYHLQTERFELSLVLYSSMRIPPPPERNHPTALLVELLDAFGE